MLVGACGSVKNLQSDAEMRRARARALYMEGVRQESMGSPSSAFEFYQRAAEADSTYAEALWMLGSKRLTLRIDTMLRPSELEKSLGMMRKFVDEYPADHNEALYYGFVAEYVGNLDEAERVYERSLQLKPDLLTMLHRWADLKVERGDFKAAIDLYNRAETMEGINEPLTISKVGCYLGAQDTVSAMAEVQRLINSNPQNPDFHMLKGNVYQVLGQKDSTLVAFKHAEEINPGYGPVKYALANYYQSEGDSVAYDEKIYEALLSEDFGLDEKGSILAKYLQKLMQDNNDTKRGDYLFSVLKNQYPHEAELQDLAARYSAAKGNYAQASEEMSYAIDLSPADEKYRRAVMGYLLADNRPEEAMKKYQESLKFVKPSVEMMTIYAAAAHAAGDYALSVATAKDMIHQIVPSLPVDKQLTTKMVHKSVTYEELYQLSRLFMGIGDSETLLENVPEATTAYENAILLFPDNQLAMNNYAYFLIEHGGDMDYAEELSRKSLTGDSAESASHLDTYAWILYKQGKYEEAKSNQEKAIESAEKNGNSDAELYLHYGDILEALGDKQGAEESYRKGLELEPDNAELMKKAGSKAVIKPKFTKKVKK